MKLYYTPGTCSVACWIALEWAGAEFDVAKADYGSAEFRRVNPLAMVPALEIGGPRAMTQAGAVLTFIADRYPAAGLGPDNDEWGRFEFGETLSFLTGDFHPAFWPFFVPQRYTTDTSPQALDKIRNASLARIERVMIHLDDMIGNASHLYRGRRSVADAYAFVMARWTAKLPRTFRDYPNVRRFMEAMEQDAAVSRVLRLSIV